VTARAVAASAAVAILGWVPAPAQPAPSEDRLARSDVFVGGRDGYHTYRIPALIVTRRGTLLAFAEGRKNDRVDHGDIDLVVKRSDDLGRTWSERAVVHEQGGSAPTTIGNPTPIVDQDTGSIWLPFTRNNRDVFVTRSDDDGRSWTPPREITASVKRPDWGWYATGPGVGIRIRNGRYRGRLVVPSNHGATLDGRVAKHSHVFWSDDDGASWQLGGTVARHTDESQVAELSDGRLVINMRNYWARDGGEPEKGGRRALAWSRDGGESWSPLVFDETLVEPMCQASLVRIRPEDRADRRLLFANPATPNRRERLTVRLSPDDGASWPLARVLDLGPSAYSSIAVLPDRSIGLLYERGELKSYERISFVRFDLGWLGASDPATR
jgi:sialidase-1